MAIKHSTTKTSGDKGYAADWNAEHDVTDPNTAKRAATLIVAASDSEDQDRADYVCDGTADAVQVQQAHDDLPAAGGRILLLEGNYEFHTAAGGAYVTITKDNVWIQGQGNGTNIKWTCNAVTTPTAFFANPAENLTLSDFQIEVDGAGDSWLFLAANGSHNFELRNIFGTGNKIWIETADTCNYMRLFNLLLQNSDVNVSLHAGTRCDIQKLRGLNIDIDFWNGFTKSMVCNNNLHDLDFKAGANNNMVHDNITNNIVDAGTGNDKQDNKTGW
jgi:hypothetical protein